MIAPLEKRSLPDELCVDGLVLKRQSVSYASEFYTAINAERERLGRFFPHMKTLTLEDEQVFLAKLAAAWESLTSFNYAVFSSAQELVGGIGTANLDWDHHCAEIGYFVFSKFEGKSIAYRACHELEQQLFGLGMNRIEIRCNEKNERSRNLALRLGYKLEGIRREDAIENGGFRNTCLFGKLRRENNQAISSKSSSCAGPVI